MPNVLLKGLVYGTTLVFVTLMLSSCVWQVRPGAATPDSAPVFLTRYAQHSRIALPKAPDRFVEFGFGDWYYYALGEKGLWSSLRAAFFSPYSALSRRELLGTLDTQEFLSWAGGEQTVLLWVDTELAEQLLQQLEKKWESLTETRVYRETDGLYFAQWDRPYFLLRNSNHQTADWLRRLDVDVRGWTILSDFRIVPE
jgi:hypothetical protein